MASHTWNSETFDRATKVADSGIVRKTLEFDYPGVDGVDVIRLGFRKRVVVIRGEKKDTSIANLVTWRTTILGKVKTASATLVAHGESLSFCELSSFETSAVSRADGGFAFLYQAIFTQLRPNSA